MTSSQRKNQVRLKIYIPEIKFQDWTDYLEEFNPISEFFFNFSLWVRKSLLNLPEKESIALIPFQNRAKFQKNLKKLEKTVWISKTHKQALMQKKGILSLNAFILLILDLNIYGSTTEKQNIQYMFQLRERIENLENRVFNLIDQLNVKYGENY
ncbi:hypothetical protein DSAG12_00775 [Promethearchaeum syntrophicum]|uniref:Uncharacterized protein n=1 Tax=Promethearchaeum syntrophicum TaxID=2594042 RepID=A0A5B9D7A5_9ARCH|nr:hypothetical protein [Candidatus Prometheoarchaeum syntrophicum]QEE14952.1 hypothetical protein DSAG12_00775 [Candidatus Prometheoarchaeum syntrophicum]